MMQLLAMSRTFAGVRDVSSRYKMRTTLPKFGPVEGRNENGAEAGPAQSERAEDLFDAAPAVRVARYARAVQEGSEGQESSEPGGARWGNGLAERDGQVELKVARGRRIRWGGFWSRWFGKRNEGEERWVQGELMLEAVKVVRNDLKDADLELVVIKRKAERKKELDKPMREGGPEAGSEGGSGGLIWNRLAARLFAMER